MRPPATAARLLLLCALCATGCATTRPEPDPPPYRPYQLAPPPQPPAPPRAAPKRAEAISLDGEPVRVDAALIRFAVRQRETRASVRKGELMPAAVRTAWSEILGELDRLLRQSARATPPLEVVRARVALDAELDLDREHYFSFPEDLAASVKARSLGLDRRLAEIRTLGKSAASPVPAKLSWPIQPAVVTSLFGMRADPIHGEDRDHQGVDLKAYRGQIVEAAAEGVVVRAGRAGGHGLQVTLRHDDGLITRYSHLSTLLVTEGMRVPAHGPVGLAGNTGRSTGPHLHFEIWRDGEPIDPLAELPDPSY